MSNRNSQKSQHHRNKVKRAYRADKWTCRICRKNPKVWASPTCQPCGAKGVEFSPTLGHLTALGTEERIRKARAKAQAERSDEKPTEISVKPTIVTSPEVAEKLKLA